MTEGEFDQFCDEYMMKADLLVPARLQTALALLERLRDNPALDLTKHTVKGGAGLQSHESWAKKALDRYSLAAVNKNSGRRSSNLPEWGQPLLKKLEKAGFSKSNSKPLEAVQVLFANKLRAVLESDPLSVRIEGRTAESVIGDLIEQADDRDKAGAVAQYLVAAKLKLRFPNEKIPVRQFNQRDTEERRADFQIGAAAIEVALGTADDKHIEQVRAILEETQSDVWLLVRTHRLNGWRDELADALEKSLLQRLVLTSIESFVGQNVTELGGFSLEGKAEQLRALFKIYNEQWIDVLGPKSIRILTR
ncbi:MAG: DUF4928 family protein [Phycisphaerales bacterium]